MQATVLAVAWPRVCLAAYPVHCLPGTVTLGSENRLLGRFFKKGQGHLRWWFWFCFMNGVRGILMVGVLIRLRS